MKTSPLLLGCWRRGRLKVHIMLEQANQIYIWCFEISLCKHNFIFSGRKGSKENKSTNLGDMLNKEKQRFHVGGQIKAAPLEYIYLRHGLNASYILLRSRNVLGMTISIARIVRSILQFYFQLFVKGKAGRQASKQCNTNRSQQEHQLFRTA